MQKTVTPPKKDMLEYLKSHWKGSKIYRFSHSTTQNFLHQPTMVADIFENFELPSKKFLAMPQTFVIVKSVAKFGFCFPNKGNLTNKHFNNYSTFSESQFKGPFWILNVSWHASVVNAVVILIEYFLVILLSPYL